ncbi:hypothetical protein [Novosphingobium lentum]|uniref:hypothetical protein n=1 Tax=Novosphingobium lentum TaxID=145287 RepID=UPI000A50C595|nr:hypothetical protein [Novosphingobium lentum]
MIDLPALSSPSAIAATVIAAVAVPQAAGNAPSVAFGSVLAAQGPAVAPAAVTDLGAIASLPGNAAVPANPLPPGGKILPVAARIATTGLSAVAAPVAPAITPATKPASASPIVASVVASVVPADLLPTPPAGAPTPLAAGTVAPDPLAPDDAAQQSASSAPTDSGATRARAPLGGERLAVAQAAPARVGRSVRAIIDGPATPDEADTSGPDITPDPAIAALLAQPLPPILPATSATPSDAPQAAVPAPAGRDSVSAAATRQPQLRQPQLRQPVADVRAAMPNPAAVGERAAPTPEYPAAPASRRPAGLASAVALAQAAVLTRPLVEADRALPSTTPLVASSGALPQAVPTQRVLLDAAAPVTQSLSGQTFAQQSRAVPDAAAPVATTAVAAAMRSARGAGRVVEAAPPAGDRASDASGAVFAASAPLVQTDPAFAATASVPSAARPVDFATLVDAIDRARAHAAPHSVSVSLAHAEFGAVSLRFRHDDDGLSVAMASADPGFARAVAASSPTAALLDQTRSDRREPDQQSSASLNMSANPNSNPSSSSPGSSSSGQAMGDGERGTARRSTPGSVATDRNEGAAPGASAGPSSERGIFA